MKGWRAGMAWTTYDHMMGAVAERMGPYYDPSNWRTVRVCYNVTYKRRRTFVA